MSDITILLAEDDAAQAAAIRQAIESIDPAWSLDIVEDLTMPKMGGMQVLQVLRRVRGSDRSRMPPVVVLTSTAEDAELVNQQNLGPFTSIHKAVEPQKLVEDLRRVTLHWLTWAEPAGRRPVRTP
jgi:CheY-like chemotaxis protein